MPPTGPPTVRRQAPTTYAFSSILAPNFIWVSGPNRRSLTRCASTKPLEADPNRADYLRLSNRPQLVLWA